MAAPESTSEIVPPRQNFATTHWSVVLLARDGDPTAAFGALERLCCDYWRPVYAFVRREGYGPPDAQELTQEFLSRFVHKEWLNHLKDRRGKFRSFLLTFLKHFLSDYRDHVGRLKRGGGMIVVPLDELETEEVGAANTTGSLTAEQTFDLRWANEVMERTVAELHREFVSNGKADLYEVLKDLQPGEKGAAGYAEIGARLGLSTGAVKSAVRRLRLRHRALLRAEIARTVIDESEVDAEIRHLIQVLGAG
jgi:DNA-directed RNA polymerase specialized sigma24 family protein